MFKGWGSSLRVLLIKLNLLKVFLTLHGGVWRSHWKMPRITCLSIPITTGNIAWSSFFPDLSQPPCVMLFAKNPLCELIPFPLPVRVLAVSVSLMPTLRSWSFWPEGGQALCIPHTLSRKVFLYWVPGSIIAQPVSENFQSSLVFDLYFSDL